LFDIYGLGRDSPEDKTGILRAVDDLHHQIKQEIEILGLTEKEVIIGGFSQGGGVATKAFAQLSHNYGALVALSTWLPLPDDFLKEMKTEEFKSEIEKRGKIFQGHGAADPVVQYQWGSATSEILKEAGFSSDFKTYAGMGHSSSGQEMKDVQNFVKNFVDNL